MRASDNNFHSQGPEHPGTDFQTSNPFLEKTSFTEEEIQSLKDIFDLFDREKSGQIEMKDLDAIMMSL